MKIFTIAQILKKSVVAAAFAAIAILGAPASVDAQTCPAISTRVWEVNGHRCDTNGISNLSTQGSQGQTITLQDNVALGVGASLTSIAPYTTNGSGMWFCSNGTVSFTNSCGSSVFRSVASGSATYTCSNGTWTGPTSATCSVRWPDLVASHASTAQISVNAGVSFQVSVNVANQGQVYTPAGYINGKSPTALQSVSGHGVGDEDIIVLFQLSSGSPGANISDIGAHTRNTGLAPSGTYSATMPGSGAKINTAGTYYIRACADKQTANDAGRITESNEGNNCSTWRQVNVTGSVVAPTGSCSPSPTTAAPGTNVTWTATVQGFTPAYFEWWGDDSLSGSNASVSKSYTTAGVKEAGFVAVNSNGSLYVEVECSPLTIVSASPNLTAGAVSPTTATAGTPVSLSATISNTGNATTGTGFINLFQRATSAQGAGATDIGTFNRATALASGGTVSATSNYTFTTAGTFYVRACADKSASANNGTIVESNESDNCSAWSAITVTNPTYTVSFNANGGSGTMPSLTKMHDVNLALSSNNFTRSGYTFTGWNTAANGSGTSYANQAQYTSNANVTLYARWTANPTASIAVTPSPTCVISSGGSTCTASVTWTSSNAPTPSIRHNGAVMSSLASGAVPERTLAYGTNTFTFYSASTQVGDPAVVSATCIAGTTWNGSICQQPAPNAPTNFSVTSSDACDTTSVNLEWSQVSGATNYIVRRSSDPSFASFTGIYSENGLLTTDSGLEPDARYYYRIRAVNGSVYSEWVTRDITLPSACGEGSIWVEDPVVPLNGTTTVSWSSENTSSCTVSGNGGPWSPDRNGTRITPPLTANTFYVLSCDNLPEDKVALITVLMTPTLRLTPRIVESGTQVLVEYVTNEQTCKLSGGPYNNMDVTDGSDTITITANTTFTLTCPGGGSVSNTIEVVPQAYES